MDGHGHAAPRALIVGAGIAGLAAAGALRGIGWDADIVEQRASFDAIETGLFFPANGVRAMAALGVKDGLASRFDDLTGPPRDVLDQITDDATVQFSAADRAWVEHPAAGRIVLAGDAWHGTSPSMAQGGAMAVEDALVLAQELASHESDGQPDPIGAALGRYAARRLPRVRHVQEATAMRTSLASLPLAQRLGVVPAWAEISVRSFAPLVPDP